MSSSNTDFLNDALAARKASGSLRKLSIDKGLTDFSSNDYLGLAQNRELAGSISIETNRLGPLPSGGTGSRLISGNHKYYNEAEQELAELFSAERVLIFNSGYHANQSLIACIAGKDDTIIYDQLSHVCLKEGAWLSKASTYSFTHNHLNHLEDRLKEARGNTFVVTESIFSMDGDIAPIEEILDICDRYGAHLIVDEAHSTGVFGPAGSGWLVDQSLHDRVFARVYTFGKAMGVHGACVAGSSALIEYLVNFARPFIYTTALPPHSVIAIQTAFRFLRDNIGVQQQLRERIAFFRQQCDDQNITSVSDTAIQPILIPGNKKCKEVSLTLQEKGHDVRAILAPTVQKGSERLRISIHTFNSLDQIRLLVHDLSNER